MQAALSRGPSGNRNRLRRAAAAFRVVRVVRVARFDPSRAPWAFARAVPRLAHARGSVVALRLSARRSGPAPNWVG